MKNKMQILMVGAVLVAALALFLVRERLTPTPSFVIINESSSVCYVEASETAFAGGAAKFTVDSGTSTVIRPWPETDYFHSDLSLRIRCGENHFLLETDVPTSKSLARGTDGRIRVRVTDDHGIVLSIK
jgi:hypothetical protein